MLRKSRSWEQIDNSDRLYYNKSDKFHNNAEKKDFAGMKIKQLPHVVIVGAGFGLRRRPHALPRLAGRRANHSRHNLRPDAESR
jgi:hypothetical protein